MKRTGLALLFLAGSTGLMAVILAIREPTPKGSTSLPAGAGDMVCGPRCLQYLIQHYRGGEEDLIDLVREVQWPDFESGASLLDIGKALEKRGIGARAVRIDPTSRLDWPHPVLVHLRGEDAIGHYVVMLPGAAEGESLVWVGLDGVRSGRSDRFGRALSGAALLTAPGPIGDLAATSAAAWPRFFQRFAGLGLGLLAGLAVMIGLRSRSRPPLGGTPTESVPC